MLETAGDAHVGGIELGKNALQMHIEHFGLKGALGAARLPLKQRDAQLGL